MCILSGCDYLPSVPGIGLTTAHKLMKKYGRNVNNVSKEIGVLIRAVQLSIYQDIKPIIVVKMIVLFS